MKSNENLESAVKDAKIMYGIVSDETMILEPTEEGIEAIYDAKNVPRERRSISEVKLERIANEKALEESKDDEYLVFRDDKFVSKVEREGLPQFIRYARKTSPCCKKGDELGKIELYRVAEVKGISPKVESTPFYDVHSADSSSDLHAKLSANMYRVGKYTF